MGLWNGWEPYAWEVDKEGTAGMATRELRAAATPPPKVALSMLSGEEKKLQA